MKKFADSEVIMLLGAGASCDAGILNSAQMIGRIEYKLCNGEWSKYQGLYQYIKSVHFQKQIFKGKSPNTVGFNIEDLVGLLDIIVRISNSEVDTYTFVGSWEKDLQPFITKEREESLVSNFKENIITELKGEWLMPDDWIHKSSYYKKLIDFKREYDGFPLKVFSLNYDLCLEQNLKGERVELGFDENEKWSFRRYDYDDINKEVSFYLYKLHGSVNWKKTNEEKLIRTEGHIKTEDLAIIFGISNKLQSYDPYLFYFYEFREHCLKANLIICSGYSFFDSHINDVIKQGLRDSISRKLAVNVFESKDELEIKKDIAERLKVNESQIYVFNKQAEKFFSEDLRLSKFEALFETEPVEALPANF